MSDNRSSLALVSGLESSMGAISQVPSIKEDKPLIARLWNFIFGPSYKSQVENLLLKSLSENEWVITQLNHIHQVHLERNGISIKISYNNKSIVSDYKGCFIFHFSINGIGFRKPRVRVLKYIVKTHLSNLKLQEDQLALLKNSLSNLKNSNFGS